MNGRETWRSSDGEVVIIARLLTVDERREYPAGIRTRVTIRQITGTAENGTFYDVNCQLLVYKWGSLQTCIDMAIRYYDKYMVPKPGKRRKRIYEQPHQKGKL